MEKWTSTKIANRFEQCALTLHRLPRGRQLGYTHCWPNIIYSHRELFQQAPTPIRLCATPEQITRADETMTWLLWLNPQQRHLIWLRAEHHSWRDIAHQMGLSKSTAHRRWQKALEVISRRLIMLDANSIQLAPRLGQHEISQVVHRTH